MKMQVEVDVSFEKPHGWACFRKEIDAPILPPGSTLFIGDLDMDIDKYYWEEKTGTLLVEAKEQIKIDDPIDDYIAWMEQSGWRYVFGSKK